MDACLVSCTDSFVKSPSTRWKSYISNFESRCLLFILRCIVWSAINYYLAIGVENIWKSLLMFKQWTSLIFLQQEERVHGHCIFPISGIYAPYKSLLGLFYWVKQDTASDSFISFSTTFPRMFCWKLVSRLWRDWKWCCSNSGEALSYFRFSFWSFSFPCSFFNSNFPNTLWEDRMPQKMIFSVQDMSYNDWTCAIIMIRSVTCRSYSGLKVIMSVATDLELNLVLMQWK